MDGWNTNFLLEVYLFLKKTHTRCFVDFTSKRSFPTKPKGRSDTGLPTTTGFHWRPRGSNLAVDHTSRLQHVTQHIPLPKGTWDESMDFSKKIKVGYGLVDSLSPWRVSKLEVFLNFESCWYLHAIPYQKASKFSQRCCLKRTMSPYCEKRKRWSTFLFEKKNVKRCFSGMLQ